MSPDGDVEASRKLHPRRGVRLAARLSTAGLAGAVTAWAVTALALYAVFVSGGYTAEALVVLPPWLAGAIGAGGGLAGVMAVLLAGRCQLPSWLRPVSRGGLAGVAAAVVLTHIVAAVLGGPVSKTQAPYLHIGLVYGVPAGLALGALGGLVWARRHTR